LQEAERSGDEVLVQDFETSIQLPDQDDKAAEVIVVIDEDLSVRAANTNANCLRTEEVTLGNFVGTCAGGTAQGSSLGLGWEVGGLEELHTFKLNASRHHRFAGKEITLTSLRALEEASVVRHHGITHVHALTRIATVTCDLAEVRVTTQVHHEGRIANTTIQTISKGRNVALTQVLNNGQKVGTYLELLNVGSVLRCSVYRVLSLTAREVVTTLAGRCRTIGFCLRQFVKEDAVTPPAIVVEQGQGTDALVEHIQVTGVQQHALGGNQSFTSNLKGAGLSRIAGVSRTGVFLKHHQDFLLGDVTAVGGTDGLVSDAFAAVLSTRAAPELVAVELNSLTRLGSKVVDNHGLYCHLADVGRVGAVKFRAQNFRKICIKKHFLLSSSVAVGDYFIGERFRH
jgi:hypothetical protein